MRHSWTNIYNLVRNLKRIFRWEHRRRVVHSGCSFSSAVENTSSHLRDGQQSWWDFIMSNERTWICSLGHRNWRFNLFSTLSVRYIYSVVNVKSIMSLRTLRVESSSIYIYEIISSHGEVMHNRAGAIKHRFSLSSHFTRMAVAHIYCAGVVVWSTPK